MISLNILKLRELFFFNYSAFSLCILMFISILYFFATLKLLHADVNDVIREIL